MEQKNAYSDVSGATGRNANGTVEAYKQIGVTLYIICWVVAASADSRVVRAIMMIALAMAPLIALLYWARRRYSR